MFVNDLSDEELAKIFAHYIYRTAVEDFHSRRSARMDEAFYATVLHTVSSNLRKVARNHRLLAATKEEELERVLTAMYAARAIEFFKYAEVFSYLCKYKVGSNWDDPVLLQTDPPKDKAAYLLDGEFREGCTRHWELDNAAMCSINKDVCNRIYTLMRKGLLPPPPRSSG